MKENEKSNQTIQSTEEINSDPQNQPLSAEGVEVIKEPVIKRNPLKLKYLLFLIPLVLVVVIGIMIIQINQITTITPPEAVNQTIKKYEGKKVLYVDSYHAEYEWSDGITSAIKEVFKDTGVELKIFRMDTKRNTEPEFASEAGIKAKEAIAEFKPDVVITSDDNAFKHLVLPFYKDASLPFVFSGLNWDASVYGAPYSNTTGMVEVSLTKELIEMLSKYAKGNRVGYLSADTETERKNLENYNKLLNIKFDKTAFVKSFDEWKKAYLAMQSDVDILIFENNAGISDWNDDAAKFFVSENVKVPVGTLNAWLAPVSLVGLTKIPNEQGEWAASSALRILDGELARNIPVVQNIKGKTFVNTKLAKTLKVVFDPSILRNAEIVE